MEPLHNRANARPSPDTRLSITATVRETHALLQHHSPWNPVTAAPAVRLDFSRKLLIRSNHRDVPLPSNLAIRILEQSFRSSKSLDTVRFLLLYRTRSAQLHRSRTRLLGALRHERHVLARWVAQCDLPPELLDDPQGMVRSGLIETNISDARAMAVRAAREASLGHLGAALDLAESALAMDFDCGPAAQVILRAQQRSRLSLPFSLLGRARVCVGRRMQVCAAALRRLNGSHAEPHFAHAQRVAQRHLAQLRRRWAILHPSMPSELVAIAPPTSPFDTLIEFTDMWVDAFCDASRDTYARFRLNQIVNDTAGRLLSPRMGMSTTATLTNVFGELEREMFTALTLNNWLLFPAQSERELQDSLARFLARRIDWGAVLNRSGGGATSLRDDLHRSQEDGEGDDRADDDGEDARGMGPNCW